MDDRFPVNWANWGPASKLLAQAIRAHGRPLLVISIPRSGSSWVGEVLGAAPNALYLREPVNQRHLESGGQGTIFYIDPDAPPAHLHECGDAAFSGLPVFRRGIVRDTAQWPIRERRHKRVVIKEVNPLALPWFLAEYGPTVILLVRHPAAVACSYWQLGWLGTEQRLAEFDPRLLEGPLRPWKDLAPTASGFWRAQGLFQGLVTRFAIDTLSRYSDYKIVTYESLCTDPQALFGDLFEFAQLTCDASTLGHIEERSSSDHQDTQGAYGTRRNSRDMVGAWKKKIEPGQLAMLRDGYLPFGLPYYNSAADWAM